MILELLGYFFPGGPYFEKRKALRMAKKVQSGGEVVIEAVRVTPGKKVTGGYLRLTLLSMWWRPNREISAGEVLLHQSQSPLKIRPVDEDAFRRGAPKYWMLVALNDGQRETTVAVSAANANWLVPIVGVKSGSSR